MVRHNTVSCLETMMGRPGLGVVFYEVCSTVEESSGKEANWLHSRTKGLVVH